MPKISPLIVAFFVVFALNGVVASTAFATGEWQIEGESFKSGETRELLPTSLVIVPARLKIPMAGTEIVCKGERLDLTNGKLIAPAEMLVGSVVFHECTTEGTGGCSVAELISTVPVRGLAHLHGPAGVLILLSPATKVLLATIAFKGEMCALKNETTGQPVIGGVHLLIHNGQVFKLTHLLLEFTLAGKLKVGGDEAELTGGHWQISLLSHRLFRFV